jgi:hypothetical protein
MTENKFNISGFRRCSLGFPMNGFYGFFGIYVCDEIEWLSVKGLVEKFMVFVIKRAKV